MADFDLPGWWREGTDGPTVAQMCRDVRRFRRMVGRGGHRLRPDTLKTVWVSADHAVVNHRDDAVWQHWFRDSRRGWQLIDWHSTRRQAQAAAELPVRYPDDPDLSRRDPGMPGLRVVAGWPELAGDRIWVSCSTDYTAEQISEVLERIGCVTRREIMSIQVESLCDTSH